MTKNIANIANSVWKIMVKNQVKKLYFQSIYEANLANKKTKKCSRIFMEFELLQHIAAIGDNSFNDVELPVPAENRRCSRSLT